ncbi:MAG TPA: NAD(P)H:quinone oxidoreductase [Acidobacteriota bacterium]|nr:NAD(P)H:quinone oxidoreductase [Acidobacteriota bacterium]
MKIMVLYYSMTGNIFELAKSVAEGAAGVEGVDVLLRRVPELIPEEKFNDAMKTARDAQSNVPVVTIEELEDVDGLLIGTPTRFGNMAAQMKNFIDQTGGLWQKGSLIGKPFGVFTGSATQHGGQESTILTSIIPFIHQGMVYVGLPYSNQELFGTEKVRGGSPYGASVVVGARGNEGPKAEDKKLAAALGERVAEIAKKLSS